MAQIKIGDILLETVKIVNIKDTVLYYIKMTKGTEKVTIKTDKNTFTAFEKAIGKEEVKAK